MIDLPLSDSWYFHQSARVKTPAIHYFLSLNLRVPTLFFYVIQLPNTQIDQGNQQQSDKDK
jgi:hypothetical protein